MFVFAGFLAGSGFFPLGSLLGAIVGGVLGSIPAVGLAIVFVSVLYFGVQMKANKKVVVATSVVLPVFTAAVPVYVLRQVDGGVWFTVATWVIPVTLLISLSVLSLRFQKTQRADNLRS